jgi:hypothetical protein
MQEPPRGARSFEQEKTEETETEFLTTDGRDARKDLEGFTRITPMFLTGAEGLASPLEGHERHSPMMDGPVALVNLHFGAICARMGFC